jgi:hypothetical protein
MSSLTNFEKKVILVCISFMYKYGHFFVGKLWKGHTEERQSDWQDLRLRLATIHGKVKRSMDSDVDYFGF